MSKNQEQMKELINDVRTGKTDKEVLCKEIQKDVNCLIYPVFGEDYKKLSPRAIIDICTNLDSIDVNKNIMRQIATRVSVFMFNLIDNSTIKIDDDYEYEYGRIKEDKELFDIIKDNSRIFKDFKAYDNAPDNIKSLSRVQTIMMELYGYEMHSVDEIETLLDIDSAFILKLIARMKDNILGISSVVENMSDYASFDEKETDDSDIKIYGAEQKAAETEAADEYEAYEPENADLQKLIWKSDNEKVATTDENGKVTAVGNGTAEITVTTEDGKITASIMITVKVPDEPTINKTTGFRRLRARSVKQTKTSVTLQWNIIKDADGYFIYGNRCNTGTKSYKYRKLATITGGDISTWTQKDLKKGTYYKYVVKAYRLVNGKKVVTDTSISVHAVTGGGKYGNAKAVSVTQIGNKRNVSKITLKMGKTAQIKAKEVKKDKKIERHRKLCYESSNTKVATVTPDGLIRATGKGTCTIWVYAQNGIYKALKITVK